MMSKRSLLVGTGAGLLVCLGSVVGWVAHVRAEGISTTGALTYTGTLEDANGAPAAGTMQVKIELFDAESGGTQRCTVSRSVTLAAGRFSVLLPDTCTQAVRDRPDLWVDVTVDGNSVGRTKLGAVPYAVEASHAVSATVANGAGGALSTQLTGHTNQITALTNRVAALEAKPQPLTVIERRVALSTDPWFGDCANNSGTFPQGACARMASSKCRALGYGDGYFQGDISANEMGIVCIKK